MPCILIVYFILSVAFNLKSAKGIEKVPTRISIQKRQFLDAGKAVFAEIDRLFRDSPDMLFITDGSKIMATAAHSDYLEAFYNGNTNVDDILKRDFSFLYENRLEQADTIFSNGKVTQIPVFDENDTPLFILQDTKHPVNQSFYCRCLTGQGVYNFSINADLSVSCHCHLREAGELGSLKDATLYEIFHSPYVNAIREKLRDGCLLSSKCLNCYELIAAPESLCEYYLHHYSFPKTIMLENTSVCNLRCKNCFNEVIEKATVSLEDFEKISKQLAENKVQNIHLFKYGETFTDKDVNAKLDILRSHLPNSKITVSTNGVALNKEESIDATMKLNYLIVSLFGTDDETVTKYQRGSNFSLVYENMRKVAETRNLRKQSEPLIIWKLVMFKWNDSDDVINAAFEKAVEADVDILDFYAGWHVKQEERTDAIFTNKLFLKYMEMYEFYYVSAGGCRFSFNLKKPKLKGSA